jgi:hypothetical protein
MRSLSYFEVDAFYVADDERHARRDGAEQFVSDGGRGTRDFIDRQAVPPETTGLPDVRLRQLRDVYRDHVHRHPARRLRAFLPCTSTGVPYGARRGYPSAYPQATTPMRHARVAVYDPP